MKGIITTNSGIHFDLRHPTKDMICIEDIAHHLSKLCRFTGAIDPFYSVAQHSLYCSWLVPPEHALTALMHDSTEAYLGDVSKPLKQLLSDYQRLEKIIWAAICQKYDLPLVLPKEVKDADAQAYVKERDHLFASSPGVDDGLHENMVCVKMPKKLIYPAITQDVIKFRFLQRFRELMEKRNG